MSRKRKALKNAPKKPVAPVEAPKRPPGRPPVPRPVLPPEEPGPYNPPPQDGAGPKLQDLRHVWMNDPSHDKTPGQKRARQFMMADIGKFNVALDRLEDRLADRAQAQLEKEGGEDGPKKRDMGAERARELIERLLDEFDAQEAKRGVA